MSLLRSINAYIPRDGNFKTNSLTQSHHLDFCQLNHCVEDDLNSNGRGLSCDVGSAVLSVSHTLVTSSFQLLNCVFLFRIYAPQSPAPLPKLGLTRVCMCKFSHPKGIHSETEAFSAQSTLIFLPFTTSPFIAP